ncbi:MAG TPA: AMP-binding protein [Steroidobacteraceae bacterium]|nr:AMP-binding protein [Steroidobacteraceae bacterium]
MAEQKRVFRQELTPTHFLERAGDAFADRIAVTDGKASYTWREFRDRARRFASALRANGLQPGDRVAFLGLNCEPLLLAHFAVPLAGGVLVAINTRWSATEIGYVIEHSGARWMFYSEELAAQLSAVPANVRRRNASDEFETLLDEGKADALESWLTSEDDSIAINYTSGTTGRPKGVVYHHRGAYLNAIAMALDHRLTATSRYLWTLPMFHCNGWTFPWGLAAVGAHSVCIPRIDPAQVWRMFEDGITHFCAAPTVLIMLSNDPSAHRLQTPVRVFTAGAPPSPTLIARMTQLNFELDHVYGLTETYGPCTINVPPAENARSTTDRSLLRARQGFANALAGEVRVVDDEMQDVAADGSAMGEVVMRGNVVMKGYFADPGATEKAFAGGWFHSGDLAVMHPDRSIELRDRKKDIIISGGENISTIEVEQAVASHPAVLEAAVIAIPHDKWGEVPKAFVTLKNDVAATEAEILEHCRARLAKFKVPHSVEFGELPKTSTGKIQKFVLREREWQGKQKRIN